MSSFHSLRNLVTVLGLATLPWLVTPAAADITFSYSGICTPTPCPDVGLDVGDAVSGLITFADAAVVPNGSLTSADVTDFSLDFGTIDIDLDSAFAFYLEATLDATATGFTVFTMIVSDAFNDIGGLLLLDTIGWAGGAGGCLSLDCFDFFIIDGSFGLGAAITQVTDVPSPSAAFVLLLPLAMLARRGRRRPSSLPRAASSAVASPSASPAPPVPARRLPASRR